MSETSVAAAVMFVPRHVFVCLHERYFVFLDLRKDKYFAVAASKAGPLTALADGRPLRSDPRENGAVAAQATGEGALHALLDRGLLTRDRAAGKVLALTASEMPDAQLLADAFDEQVSYRIFDVCRFVACAVKAWCLLRLMPFERVIGRVRRRKEKRTARDADLDLGAVRRCVALYERMRPLFFGAHDACLLETLALIEFLAGYGFFPTWVFAVRTTPFRAHCWVQYRGVVFTGTIGHTRGFTPVMTV